MELMKDLLKTNFENYKSELFAVHTMTFSGRYCNSDVCGWYTDDGRGDIPSSHTKCVTFNAGEVHKFLCDDRKTDEQKRAYLTEKVEAFLGKE